MPGSLLRKFSEIGLLNVQGKYFFNFSELMSRAYSAHKITVFKSAFSHVPIKPISGHVQEQGAYHGAEIAFLWQDSKYLAPQEMKIAKSMLDSFISFVHGKVPWDASSVKYYGKAFESNDLEKKCNLYEKIVAKSMMMDNTDSVVNAAKGHLSGSFLSYLGGLFVSFFI
jgi:hypothetical protein